MKKTTKWITILIFLFLYLPMLVLVVASFNTGKSMVRFDGFTFDRYQADLLLDAINRAKTLYFTNRERWDQMVIRDMEKDVSWEKSAAQYRDLYLRLKP